MHENNSKRLIRHLVDDLWLHGLFEQIWFKTGKPGTFTVHVFFRHKGKKASFSDMFTRRSVDAIRDDLMVAYLIQVSTRFEKARQRYIEQNP